MTQEQIAEWDETPETDEEFRVRHGYNLNNEHYMISNRQRAIDEEEVKMQMEISRQKEECCPQATGETEVTDEIFSNEIY